MQRHHVFLPNDCLARRKDALVINWTKYFENYTDEGLKEDRKSRKADDERRCINCFYEDSDTIMLKKCDRCNVYYYCSTDCQSKHWQTGHAGECRLLEILKNYHRPFGKEIRDDITNITNPKDIPELQELRNQLGLSRPKSEYQDLLD
jgi:hypothetical protein